MLCPLTESIPLNPSFIQAAIVGAMVDTLSDFAAALNGVLAGFFSQVFGGDSFERKKPDPLPLLKTCEALGTLADIQQYAMYSIASHAYGISASGLKGH